MEVTVDASVILAVILNEPSKPGLLRATKGTELLSPPSLPWEVGNALSALFKRRRIDEDEAELALESFSQIPIRLPSLDIGPSVTLAKRYDVYAYDAYVIDCARRYKTPILTLDRRQSDVARSEGLTVLEIDP